MKEEYIKKEVDMLVRKIDTIFESYRYDKEYKSKSCIHEKLIAIGRAINYFQYCKAVDLIRLCDKLERLKNESTK